MPASDRRWIPSVDAVLRQLPQLTLPRPLIVAGVRRHLAALRDDAAGEELTIDQIISKITSQLHAIARSRIQPVINATGIILHTNLGRAPMGKRVADAVHDAASGFNTLEFDLLTGERGKRGAYVEHALATLCESEAATVVNNCAAALMLIVKCLTAGERKHVIISRGELVQIGGGFRVPDILHASGAILREVGTTNQTNLDDFRRAIGDDVAMILRVHRSNFFMDGFVASPSIAELATVAREANVPLVDDIGSGAIFDTTTIHSGVDEAAAPPREPTPADALSAGADIVCFSGDKLFGGPQSGIIAGGSGLVARLKREPIFRALRCDKMVLTALQATVEELLADLSANLPFRQMLDALLEDLRARAQRIIDALPDAKLTMSPSVARVGGGSMPQAQIPSISIQLPTTFAKPQALLAHLRECTPPIIATVFRERVMLDLRTVFPEQDALLIATLRSLFAASVTLP